MWLEWRQRQKDNQGAQECGCTEYHERQVVKTLVMEKKTIIVDDETKTKSAMTGQVGEVHEEEEGASGGRKRNNQQMQNS